MDWAGHSLSGSSNSAHKVSNHQDQVGNDGKPEILVGDEVRKNAGADFGQSRQEREDQRSQKDEKRRRIKTHDFYRAYFHAPPMLTGGGAGSPLEGAVRPASYE